MIQVTELDDGIIGIILPRSDAERLTRLIGNHTGSILTPLYNALCRAKINECPEQFGLQNHVLRIVSNGGSNSS